MLRRLSNRRQLRLISEISITPLFDLMLILLFVFLLVAPLLKKDNALSLPKRPTPGLTAPEKVSRLFVHRDQSVTLDGAMLARVDLPAALDQLASRQPQPGVEVRLHRDLQVQHVVEIMDLLQAARIAKTTIATHADEP
jgi:biopolymer transport protein ExbD